MTKRCEYAQANRAVCRTDMMMIRILPEDFDPWEILNSPVGPLAAYIGAYMCMLFAVIGIKWPLKAASEISAWRRKRRGSRRSGMKRRKGGESSGQKNLRVRTR